MFNHSKNKQTGGTLLGLILGLVIGLSIAVVVAVMVMKTPTPFSDKQARPDRSTQAATVTDPNQPLYGKRDSVKPIVTNPAPADAGVTGSATGSGITPAAPPVASTAPTSSTRPSDHAPAVPNVLLQKPPTPGAKTDSGQWIYYLQAGAFRSHDDAESTRARLALLGFEAQISERQSDQGTLYRVRLGPFTQLDTTNRMRSKLTDNGVDAAVVRSAK